MCLEHAQALVSYDLTRGDAVWCGAVWCGVVWYTLMCRLMVLAGGTRCPAMQPRSGERALRQAIAERSVGISHCNTQTNRRGKGMGYSACRVYM